MPTIEQQILYISNIRNGIDWDTEYTVLNLHNNTQYRYTIFAKYNEDNNTKTYNTSGTFNTINEDVVMIEKLIIRNTSADLSWTSVGSTDVSYILQFNNKTTEYSNIQTMQKFQDLSINTTYDISLSVVYKNTNHKYSKNIFFRTLNEDASTIKADVLYKHPLYGNMIILTTENRNLYDLSENCVYFNNVVYATKTQLDISNFQFNQIYYGNVHTLYNVKQGKDYIQYETKEYITDFSFLSVMIKPIATIYNTSVKLNWMPLSTDDDVSYNITIKNRDNSYDYTTYIPNGNIQYTLNDLEINTIYDVSFTRDYGNYVKTNHLVCQTLNESPLLNVNNNIVLNSGLYGNLVVMDISNVNRNSVSENILNIKNMNNVIGQYNSYITNDNMIDIDVSYSNTYNGNIITIYKPTLSADIYQLYVTEPYQSYDFSFTVGPNVDNIHLIQNGKFDLSMNYNYKYNYQPTTGTVKTTPPKWYGESILIADNSNGSLIGHKYLADETVSQHVLLYNYNPSQSQASLSKKCNKTIYLKIITIYRFM